MSCQGGRISMSTQCRGRGNGPGRGSLREPSTPGEKDMCRSWKKNFPIVCLNFTHLFREIDTEEGHQGDDKAKPVIMTSTVDSEGLANDVASPGQEMFLAVPQELLIGYMLALIIRIDQLQPPTGSLSRQHHKLGH